MCLAFSWESERGKREAPLEGNDGKEESWLQRDRERGYEGEEEVEWKRTSTT